MFKYSTKTTAPINNIIKPSFKLYELAEEVYLALNDLIDQEKTDDAIEKCTASIEKFDNKASSVGAYILNLQGDIENIKLTEKRLEKRRKSLEAHVESIKNYLLMQMLKARRNRINSPDSTFTIKVKENPDSINVISENDIPESYIKTQILKKIDKLSIKDDLKKGAYIPGVELIKRKQVEIK